MPPIEPAPKPMADICGHDPAPQRHWHEHSAPEEELPLPGTTPLEDGGEEVDPGAATSMEEVVAEEPESMLME